MAPNAIYVGYMLGALAVLAVAYATPGLDLRAIGGLRRVRQRPHSEDEHDYDAPKRRPRRAPDQDAALPRADLIALIAIFGALGVALGAALGFLGPRWIESAYAEEAPATFVWTAGEPLARAAQLVGALAFGFTALRLLRVFMALAVFAALAVTAHVAVAYTLGRPIWEPLGL